MFEKRTLQGAYLALMAFGTWGVAPVFFKQLSHVSAVEILCHRVIWSLLLLLAILTATGQLQLLRAPRRTLALCLLTAALLSANWLLFIYAIINDNIIETSLGYFINPLVSVFLGMIFLGERLRPLQWLAIAIAALGIGIQIIAYGQLPWISLTLAFSFGFYGLLRKRMNMPAVAGLALETLVMLPVALLGLAWFHQTGSMSFGTINISTNMLLMLGGVITSVPLLCFTAAVTRLSLAAAGMFQYLAPSLSLVLAVMVYGEPFGTERLVTFACIWTALAIFSVETLHFHRRLAARLAPATLTVEKP